MTKDVSTDHLWADIGPIRVDSSNLGPELVSVAAVLGLLIVFKVIIKRI